MAKEKDVEIRLHSEWIQSRLIERHSGLVREYDHILYVNGYRADSPYLICEWGGTQWSSEGCAIGPYLCNDFEWCVTEGVWVITNTFIH